MPLLLLTARQGDRSASPSPRPHRSGYAGQSLGAPLGGAGTRWPGATDVPTGPVGRIGHMGRMGPMGPAGRSARAAGGRATRYAPG